MLRGIELPPRGSVRSCIMEEMVHRERIRSWKSLMLQLNTLVAHTVKSSEALSEVGKDLSELYDMIIHNAGAYRLDDRLKDNSRSDSNSKKDIYEIAKLVEGLPDV